MRNLSLAVCVLVWMLVAVMPSGAQTKGSPVTCASCHQSEAMQPTTPMGRALELSGDNPTLAAHPSLIFRKGGYLYSITTRGGKTTYTVTDGKQTISVPVNWGVGMGGQTWMLERDGKFYESLVSYYPTINGLDITTGDEPLAPHTLDAALGRELSKEDAKTCFGCHATNAISNDALDLASMKPGVTCEHCHTGALTHLADASRGDFNSTPPDLGSLSSESLSNFCGQCHRTWETVVRHRWRGTMNVRFQPYRLANSRCFNGTDPRISCVACHNPHENVVRNTAYYDSKCLQCHVPPMKVATAATAETPKVCPVAKSNCITCHMPRVALAPGSHLTFTDHQIRIVKPGEPYPN